MRVVVADTGPLNYLVLIGAIELLPSLFGQIFVLVAVHDELARAETPPAVKTWLAQQPAWLVVEPNPEPGAVGAAVMVLDEGERAAIALAKTLKADLLLIDDREGVAVARGEGFAVTGTLGVLDLAAWRGMVDLAAAFDRLTATSFRYRQELLDAILAQHAGRERP